MDISEDDQATSGGDGGEWSRWGRPIKTGVYDYEVVDAQEGITNDGSAKATVTLEFRPGYEAAPEGPVKIDYVGKVKTFSLRNIIETFDPGKVGKAATLDLGSYVGMRGKASVKWEDAVTKPDGRTFRAGGRIVKLLGPATRPLAAKTAEDEI
jgi:hypothetical protein